MTPAGPVTPEAAPVRPPVAPRRGDSLATEARKRFAAFVHGASKDRKPRDAMTLIAQAEKNQFKANVLASKPDMTQERLNMTVEAMQKSLDKQVSEMLKSKDPKERAAAHDFMKYRLMQEVQGMSGQIDMLQKRYDEAKTPEEKSHYSVQLGDAKKRLSELEQKKGEYMNIDGTVKTMTYSEQVKQFSDQNERNKIVGADGNPVPDSIVNLVKKFGGYEEGKNPLTFLGDSIHALVTNRNKGANIVKQFNEAAFTPEERESLKTVIEMAKQGKTDEAVWAERAAKGGLMGLLMMFLFAYLSSKMDKGGGQQMAAAHG